MAVMETAMSDLNGNPDAEASLCMLRSRQQIPGYSEHQAWVRGLLDVTSTDTVLEVGCGAGTHLPYFDQVAAWVVAVEPSDTLRRQARAASSVPVLSATWESCEPGGPFTAILFDKVLTHLHDPVEALRKAVTVASLGARILVVNLDGMSTTVNPGLNPDDRDAVNHVLAWRAAYGTASGWVSTAAPSVLTQAGWRYVTTHAWTVAFTTLEEAEHYTPLSTYGIRAYQDKAVTLEDCRRWEHAIGSDPATFACTLTVRADLAVFG